MAEVKSAAPPLPGKVRSWVLGCKLGCGSFGQVYAATHETTGVKVSVKLERADAEHPQLMFEAKILKVVKGIGFPHVYWYGLYGNWAVMVLERLGPSLEDVFAWSNRVFSLQTAAFLGIQMLRRIETVHQRGYLHRDIKPDNFLCGPCRSVRQAQVYAIDFGLGKRYRDANYRHIPFKDGKSLTGTARYVSIRTHLGYEQSRADDIEGIAYVLLYFLRGSLPWQGLRAAGKKEKYLKIKRTKIRVSVEQLCESLPPQIAEFLTICRGLAFEEAPDYEYLRTLLRNAGWSAHTPGSTRLSAEWEATLALATANRGGPDDLAEEDNNNNNNAKAVDGGEGGPDGKQRAGGRTAKANGGGITAVAVVGTPEASGTPADEDNEDERHRCVVEPNEATNVETTQHNNQRRGRRLPERKVTGGGSTTNDAAAALGSCRLLLHHDLDARRQQPLRVRSANELALLMNGGNNNQPQQQLRGTTTTRVVDSAGVESGPNKLVSGKGMCRAKRSVSGTTAAAKSPEDNNSSSRLAAGSPRPAVDEDDALWRQSQQRLYVGSASLNRLVLAATKVPYRGASAARVDCDPRRLNLNATAPSIEPSAAAARALRRDAPARLPGSRRPRAEAVPGHLSARRKQHTTTQSPTVSVSTNPTSVLQRDEEAAAAAAPAIVRVVVEE